MKARDIFGILVLVHAPAALAQQVVWQFDGPAPGDAFGTAADSAGDVNGDGVGDFVVGAPCSDFNGVDAGTVIVYSGADGTRLHVFHGSAPGDMLGGAVAGAGDVNADGYADVIVGATSRTYVAEPYGGQYARVYSGSDGAVLFEYTNGTRLGYSVEGLGDLDGDGHADFAIGRPGGTGWCAVHCSGSLRVYSGADGSTLHFHGNSISSEGNNGFAVESMPDLDGDGVSNYVVGEVRLSGEGSYYGAGHVYRPDGTELVRVYGHWFGTANPDYLGRAVSGVGDANRDGIEDVLLSEVGETNLVSTSNPDPPIRTHLGEFLAMSHVGDVDGDGHHDYLLGEDTGIVHLHSGATGDELYVFSGEPGDGFGRAIESVGPWGGERSPAFIVGAPETTNGGHGYVQVIALPIVDCDGDGIHDPSNLEGMDCNANGIPDSCDIASGTSNDIDANGIPDECYCEIEGFCTSTPNSTGAAARILSLGTPSVSADDLVLIATDLPAGTNGVFIYSPDAVQTPLGNGTLCLGNQTQGFVNRLPPVTSDATGTLTHHLDLTQPPVPQSAILSGSTWYFQAWFRDPAAGGAGFDFSDGLRVLFCP